MKILRRFFDFLENGNPFYFLLFGLIPHLYDILSTCIALGFWPDLFAEATPLWACMIEQQGLAFTAFVCFIFKMTSPCLLYYVPLHNYLKNVVFLLYGIFGLIPCVNNTWNLICGLS